MVVVVVVVETRRGGRGERVVVVYGWLVSDSDCTPFPPPIWLLNDTSVSLATENFYGMIHHCRLNRFNDWLTLAGGAARHSNDNSPEPSVTENVESANASYTQAHG